MSSRNSIVHVISNNAPVTSQIGDEYFSPTTGKLYKNVVSSGTNVGFSEIPILSQPVNITNTSVSYSTQTGALTVAGGVAIAGDLRVAGTFYGTISGSVSNATNLSGGTAGQLVYQTGASATSFTGPGSWGQFLISTGANAPTYQSTLTTVGGNIIVTSNTAASTTNSGALQIVNGGLGVGGGAVFGGVITATTVVVSGSGGDITGATNISASGYIAGGLITATNTTAVSSTNTGALQVRGGAGIWGGLFVGNITTVSNSTAVATTNSGALQIVNGGLGIGGGIVAGGVSTITNQSSVSSTSTGALQLKGGLGVWGGAFFSGSVTATNFIGTFTGTITTATNIAGGTAGQIPYQTGAGATSFFGAGSWGQFLISTGANAPTYQSTLTTANGNIIITSNTAASTTNSGALQIVNGGLGVGGGAVFGNTVIVNQSVNGYGLQLTGSVPALGVAMKVVNTDTTSPNSFSLISVQSGALSTGVALVSGSGGPWNTGIEATISDFYIRGGQTDKDIYVAVNYNINAIKISGANKSTIFYSTLTTNSTTTGALQVYGGIGVNGGGYFNGVVTATTFVGNVTGNLSNAVTFNNANSGDASGTTYNGSAARTISANTLGALSLTGGGTVSGAVTFSGPVTFSGTATYVLSTNTFYTDNILELHTPPGGVASPWFTDDGKDIGLRFHYYTACTDTNAALVLANDTKYLEWYSAGYESTSGVFTSTTTYGIFKTGGIKLVGGTANSGNTSSGDLTVLGGVGVGGNMYVAGTITASSFSGAVTGATTQVQTVAQTASATYYPTFVDTNSGSATGKSVYTTSSFVINPATGNIGVGTTTLTNPFTVSRSVAATASPNYFTGLTLNNQNDGGARILASNSVAATLAAIDLTVLSSGAGTDDGVIAFHTAVNGTLTERSRIDNSGRLFVNTTTVSASSSELFEVYNGMTLLDYSNDSVATLYVKNRSTTANTIQPYIYFADGGGNRGGLGVQTSDSSFHEYGQGGINWYTGFATFNTASIRASIAQHTGIFTIFTTTSVSSTNTGALQVRGGIGVWGGGFFSGVVTATTFVGNITGTVTGQASSVANSLTMNNAGTGDNSGATFNGSAAKTISYNTVGAAASGYLTDAGSTRQYNSVISLDSRSANYAPGDRVAGLYADFKQNSTDGLSDGGTYHGVLTFRSYGTSLTDFSGGQAQQIAYTDNNNLWHRISTNSSTWGTWYKIIDTGNTGTAYVNRAVIADSASGGSAQVNTVLQTANASYYLTFVDSNNTSATAESVYTTSSFQINPSTGNIQFGTTGQDYQPSSGGNHTLRLNALNTSSIGFHDSGSTIGNIKFSGAYGFEIGAYDGLYGPHNTILHGTVGIGTQSPGAKLEVAMSRTSSTSGIALQLSDNVTGAQTDGVYKSIRSTSNGGSSISEIRFIESDGTNNNTAIAFATQNTAGALTERMRVTQTGALAFAGASNYGSSGQILQSNGNAAPTWVNQSSIAAGSAPLTATYVGYGSGSNLLTGSSSLTYASSILNVAYQNTFNATTPGFGTYGIHLNGQTTSNYATGITFSAGDASATNANAGIYTQGSGSYGSRMYFATTDSYAVGSKTRVMINESGNVGINTTSPSEKLTVNGSFSSSGYTNIGGTTYISGTNANTLNSGYTTAADGADLWINYRGYADGQSYYRNFNVGNGRGTCLLWVHGPSGNVGIGTGQNAVYRLDLGPSGTTTDTHKIRFSVYNGSAGTGSGYNYGSSTGGGTTQGTGIVWVPEYGGYTKRSAGILQIAEGNYFRSGLAFYTNNIADQTTDWTEAMRIGSNGNVQIGGGSSPSLTNKFEVDGSNGQLFSVVDSFTGTIFTVNDASGIPSIEVLDTGLIKFAQYNGSVAISTSTAVSGSILTVNGIVSIVGSSGELRASSEITAYYSSDVRLKENVHLITNPIEKLEQINGVYFDWTDEYIQRRGGEDGFFVRKNDIGVIAQEVETVLPEIVATREDGYKAVKYEKIVPLLIEAVKSQQQTIHALKAELQEIKDLIKGK